MQKKYIVIGGRIKSRFDGDYHYVNAKRLCELYQINPNECYLAEENMPESLLGLRFDLPVLTPRNDGIYKIEAKHS